MGEQNGSASPVCWGFVDVDTTSGHSPGTVLREPHGSDKYFDLLITEVGKSLPRQRTPQCLRGRDPSTALHSPHKGCDASFSSVEGRFYILMLFVFSNVLCLLVHLISLFISIMHRSLIIFTSLGGGPVAYMCYVFTPVGWKHSGEAC